MSGIDVEDYVTLDELCKAISVSTATGKNWLRLGKIIPQIEKNGMPLFSQGYVSQLKSDITMGKNQALKHRRNKKYASGSSVYESYISAGSANIQKIRQLMEIISGQGNVLDGMALQALLAECALQMILQREAIFTPARVNVLPEYLRERLSLNGYEFLINDLIPDKAGILSYIEENPKMFSVEYLYEESEDVLGLLYISCKNISSRKAMGAYYTPTSVVKKMTGRLFGNNSADNKKIFDPCCGTGNFLLQLPETVGMENVYGNDIDSISVCIARINLALKFRAADRDILYGHITNKDYLLSGQEEYFDYIIGNPPWGYHFSQEEKERLREKYHCAAGKYMESYDVFTEQAISNLKCGGVLSFLLPEAILNVKTHMPIREFIIRGSSIQYLEYLGDVFDKVQCPSVILQILHNHSPMDTVGMAVNDGERTYTIRTKRRVGKEYFSFAATDEEYAVLQKIEHMPHKVTLAGRAKFALGIVTGNNKKYISDTRTSENETILKGVDIHKYRFTESGNYIEYKPKLFQQAASSEYYRAPQKLLYRFICSQLVFAYDDRQTLSLNSCNVLIPEADGLEMKYVLAVLNSRVAQFYFEKSFRSLKVLRSHIEQIPIPVVGKEKQQEMIQIVDRLLVPSSDGMIERDFEILDAEIADVFGLSQSEYGIVKKCVNASKLFL